MFMSPQIHMNNNKKLKIKKQKNSYVKIHDLLKVRRWALWEVIRSKDEALMNGITVQKDP